MPIGVKMIYFVAGVEGSSLSQRGVLDDARKSLIEHLKSCGIKPVGIAATEIGVHNEGGRTYTFFFAVTNREEYRCALENARWSLISKAHKISVGEVRTLQTPSLREQLLRK